MIAMTRKLHKEIPKPSEAEAKERVASVQETKRRLYSEALRAGSFGRRLAIMDWIRRHKVK